MEIPESRLFPEVNHNSFNNRNAQLRCQSKEWSEHRGGEGRCQSRQKVAKRRNVRRYRRSNRRKSKCEFDDDDFKGILSSHSLAAYVWRRFNHFKKFGEPRYHSFIHTIIFRDCNPKYFTLVVILVQLSSFIELSQYICEIEPTGLIYIRKKTELTEFGKRISTDEEALPTDLRYQATFFSHLYLLLPPFQKKIPFQFFPLFKLKFI